MVEHTFGLDGTSVGGVLLLSHGVRIWNQNRMSRLVDTKDESKNVDTGWLDLAGWIWKICENK